MSDRMLCVMDPFPPYEPPNKPPWAQSMRPVPRRNWFVRHAWITAFIVVLLFLVLAAAVVIGVLER